MAVDALFAQADLNQDQRLDINEFRNLFPQDYSGADGAGSTSYDESNYSQGGDSTGVTQTGGARRVGGGPGLTAAQLIQLGYKPSRVPFTQYERDAQGYLRDRDPAIVKQRAKDNNLVYRQNIRIRFLQPPSPPPPGPTTISEESQPLPPLQGPVIIPRPGRPADQPPSLIIREQPPPKPAVIPPQAYIYTLPRPPVPPRRVIFDIDADAPSKPRDILMERWLPYGPSPRPQVMIKRATNIPQYPTLRNLIIQREPPPVRVIRQFQRLGITQTDPDDYRQRYGGSLLDTGAFLQEARRLGVVEDISLPIATVAVATGQPEFSASTGDFSVYGARLSGYESPSAIGATDLGTTGLALGGVVGYGLADDLGGAGEYSSQ